RGALPDRPAGASGERHRQASAVGCPPRLDSRGHLRRGRHGRRLQHPGGLTVALESWLPIGFDLPYEARCGRPLHADANWQILETRGGGSALVVREDVFAKWVAAGLVDEAEFRAFSFGSDAYREMSCGSSQTLVPLSDCHSPSSKSEAFAFAMALRETRAIDPVSPLQDAVYVEKFSRLLPSYGITSRAEDDFVL